MDTPVRLLIAEDQPLVRAGLQYLVGLTKTYTILAYASTLLHAYQLCQRLHPDILLISLNLLPLPIRPTLEQLREEYPQMRLLLLGEECNVSCLHDLLKAGVAGYVQKNDPTENVISAIRAIANGDNYFSHAALTAFFIPTPRHIEPYALEMYPLTKRETDIVNLLIKGLDNRMIASELGLAYQTVRNRLCVIYEKLGVQSRAEAIIHVTRQGSALS